MVYKNISVDPNIYVVVKSMARTFINITHVAESFHIRAGTRSIFTNIEINTRRAMLGEFAMHTVILLI